MDTARQTQHRGVQKRRAGVAFVAGMVAGVLVTLGCAAAGGYVAYRYFNAQAAQSAVFAGSSPSSAGGGQVQMYFPLERFLAWRSTPTLQLGMQNNRVSVALSTVVIPPLNLNVHVEILGDPSVWRHDFTLTHVTGYVDHIPIPTRLLLAAIAAKGAQYGVHVNDARDSLYIVRNTGQYELVGYDAATRDLIISLPVQTVLRAADNRAPL